MLSYAYYMGFVLDTPLFTITVGFRKTRVAGCERQALKFLGQLLIHTFVPLQAAYVAAPMHSSRPFSSRKAEDMQQSAKTPQLPGMLLQGGFEILEPVRGRRLTASGHEGCSPRAPNTVATLQVSLDQPDFEFNFLPTASNSSPGSMPKHEPQIRQLFYSSWSSSNSCLAQYAPPPRDEQKARYYSAALTNADKDALLRGKKNHNLKAWTAKDVVMHHESRKTLVPHAGINKLDKMEAIAQIEQEMQQSHKALNKVCSSKPPLFRLTDETGRDDPITYQPQASQSMYDLRSSSAPTTQLPPVSSVLPPIPGLSRQFSFVEYLLLSRSMHVRAASNGDYFTRPTHSQRLQQPSSPSSGSSSRVRSPLANEVPLRQDNPNQTFDSFLAPHKSGKGEAYRGAENAKKPNGSKGMAAPERDSSSATDFSSPRWFFSRISSLPSRRKRPSPRDIRKNIDDVPDVPPLP